jgi:hypothetical protein
MFFGLNIFDLETGELKLYHNLSSKPDFLNIPISSCNLFVSYQNMKTK